MNRLAGRLLDGTGTLFVFLAAAAGVVAADRYLAGSGFSVAWKDLAVGFVGAAVLVGKSELKVSDFRGKRSHFVDRMVTAFSHGMMLRIGGGIALGAIGG